MRFIRMQQLDNDDDDDDNNDDGYDDEGMLSSYFLLVYCWRRQWKIGLRWNVFQLNKFKLHRLFIIPGLARFGVQEKH